MNHGPVVFLAAFLALSASWFGFVLAPQMQLGHEVQATNLITADLYPQARPGLAQQGAEVYRASGCATCHTRQVGQTGVVIDVVLAETGTNPAALAGALTQIGAGTDAAGVPKAVLRNVTPGAAKAAAAALRKAGARAEVRIQPTGPDVARGWGARQTVARDYLYDSPVLLGSQRVGPDLANVGQRLPDANWHLRHLYAPQTVVSNSTMPRYKYLFEERPLLVRLDFQGAPGLDAALRPGQPRAADAFLLAANGTLVDASKTIGAADRELVPTHEARALVAYLLSLKTDAVLYETPMTVARRAAPAGTNASPGSALAAPGAPGASPPAPPTNAPAP